MNWVDIKTSLPEYYKTRKFCIPAKVIIFDKEKKIVRGVDYSPLGFTLKQKGLWDKHTPNYSNYGYYYKYENVTHWMYEEPILQPNL
jgi:hypothetical protein